MFSRISFILLYFNSIRHKIYVAHLYQADLIASIGDPAQTGHMTRPRGLFRVNKGYFGAA